MLGIIIGVGSVVAMFSIGAGAQQSVLGSIQDMGSNLIIIIPEILKKKIIWEHNWLLVLSKLN